MLIEDANVDFLSLLGFFLLLLSALLVFPLFMYHSFVKGQRTNRKNTYIVGTYSYAFFYYLYSLCVENHALVRLNVDTINNVELM